MTVSLYLAGEPGVGRSTVMGEVLSAWSLRPAIRLRGSLRGEPFGDVDRIRGVHLGRRGGVYSGTDQLPASALSDAVAWVHLTRALPGLILGEGSRLAHVRFLSALAERGPLLFVYLTATPATCAARRRAQSAASTSQRAFSEGAAAAVRARSHHLARLCRVMKGATVITVDTDRLAPADSATAIRTVLDAL